METTQKRANQYTKRKATASEESKDLENVENNIASSLPIYTRQKRVRKLKNSDDYVFYDMSSNSSSFETTGTSEELNKTLEQTPKYKEGDLVWAKVGGHPWWPCIATKEVKKLGNSKLRYAHFLHFYGPILEHAWVNEGSILLYRGPEEFKTYAQEQVNLAQGESLKKKLTERYQLKVASSWKETWEIAVQEATDNLPITCKYLRWSNFFKLKDSLPNKPNRKIIKKEKGLLHESTGKEIANKKIKNLLSSNSQMTDDIDYDIVNDSESCDSPKNESLLNESLSTYSELNNEPAIDLGIFSESSMLMNEYIEASKSQKKLKENKAKISKKVFDVEKEIKDTLADPKIEFSTSETYLIDRYAYAMRHIQQGLSVEEACNKYRISHLALLKCLRGGKAPRGKRTRLTESEELQVVSWLQHTDQQDLKYNEAIHLVFKQVEKIFELSKRPNPFKGKPSMDWWYDFLSRHPQIMASKPEWLRRGKVNDQYIRDVQSGKLRCTKFRRALLSAIQYIRSLEEVKPADSEPHATETSQPTSPHKFQQKPVRSRKSSKPRALSASPETYHTDEYINYMIIPVNSDLPENVSSQCENPAQISQFLQINNDDEDDDFYSDVAYEANPGYSEYLSYLEEDSGLVELQEEPIDDQYCNSL